MKDYCEIKFSKVGVENGLSVYAVRLNGKLLLTANTKQIEAWSSMLTQLTVWVANGVEIEGGLKFPIRATARYFDTEQREDIQLEYQQGEDFE